MGGVSTGGDEGRASGRELCLPRHGGPQQVLCSTWGAGCLAGVRTADRRGPCRHPLLGAGSIGSWSNEEQSGLHNKEFCVLEKAL